MRNAVAFLTSFGRAATPTPSTFAWFPLVGALIGLAVGAMWWMARHLWMPLPAAGIAVVADLALTGLLHFDGLADSGDGLIAPLAREQRMKAMADPAIGAFGLVSVSAILLLRVGALASMSPSPLALGGLWCLSRTLMVVMSETMTYARGDGLVSAFLGGGTRGGSRRVMLGASWVSGVVVAGVLVYVARGLRGLAALAGEVAAMALVALLSWRRLGGYTGDVLGASGVVGETVGLLILALR